MPALALHLLSLVSGPVAVPLADWSESLAAAGRSPASATSGLAGLQQLRAAEGPRALLVWSDPETLLAGLGSMAPWQAGPLSLIGPLPTPPQATALLDAGVSGWWPEGLDASSMVAALALDRARWERQSTARRAGEKLQAQLEERLWVDRAKGVLMTARGIGENEAFVLLRGAAMHANVRVGEVSRSVAEAAQWADALNRAGQLRMLSQRLVKLAAQRWADLEPRRARADQALTLQRLADTLAHLREGPLALRADPAGAPWATALNDVSQAGEALAAALAGRLGAAMLQRLDEQAEAVLQAAEGLIDALEAASGRRALHIINLCGRQRMRVQRVAKQALLGQVLGDPLRLAGLPALLDDFEAALRTLDDAPLSSPEIREALRAARDEWLRLLRGLHGLAQPDGQRALVQASDTLLQLFDRLTASYEHSLQVIMA
ncbi:type IV pili methyl-accepting chemotaxis transducer N-terminal domain-containing protein [Ideonella sp.]|uniref:type IV pili methyl-accepting chemotaxis transducer N-terminal domain-containing protein n=1 Tax=Ideonella sp. TaxID=1929293 RepID=UPI003BB6FD0D